MKCPHCKKEIADELVKSHSAALAGKKSKRAISEEAQQKMQHARAEGRKKKERLKETIMTNDQRGVLALEMREKRKRGAARKGALNMLAVFAFFGTALVFTAIYIG